MVKFKIFHENLRPSTKGSPPGTRFHADFAEIVPKLNDVTLLLKIPDSCYDLLLEKTTRNHFCGKDHLSGCTTSPSPPQRQHLQRLRSSACRKTTPSSLKRSKLITNTLMATASEKSFVLSSDVLQDATKCCICNHPFDDNEHVPKNLICGHHFCLECIGKLERFHHQTSQRVFNCSTSKRGSEMPQESRICLQILLR